MKYLPMSPVLIAHRGVSSQAPENTLASFKKAIMLGVPFFELDVHLSKDGVPIVIHDSNLTRTTHGLCTRRVSSLNLKELKTLDVGSWFDFSFEGETIPTLEEVLALPRGKTGVMIEIKGARKNIESLSKSSFKIIKNSIEFNKGGPVVIASFSHPVLDVLRGIDTQLPLMGLSSNLSSLKQHLKSSLKHVGLRESMINASLVSRLHSQGCQVWVYTVNNWDRYLFLKDCGVDGIITNFPQLFLKDENDI